MHYRCSVGGTTDVRRSFFGVELSIEILLGQGVEFGGQPTAICCAYLVLLEATKLLYNIWTL